MSEIIWQIACGETGRTYDQLFLDHDVMFLGPGRFGPYSRERYEKDDVNFSSAKIGTVRQIATEVHEGDLVLLRLGHRVLAIGRVVRDYEWNESFDDVYGWDLQHTRRVLWQHHLKDELEAIQKKQLLFYRNKQIPTFTQVNDARVLDPIRHLFEKTMDRALQALPSNPPKPLSLDEFCNALFEKGLGFDAAQRLHQTLEKQRRLIAWYDSNQTPYRPTEHEIVAHVILPLLLALSWSEQLLAIEWHKIDLAVFSGTPTDKTRCRMICEAKAMGHGLEQAIRQATEYCNNLSLANCHKILVADGGRFYLYENKGGKWPEQLKPTGYMNVHKLRTDHLCQPGTNAVDTLMRMTPMQVSQ